MGFQKQIETMICTQSLKGASLIVAGEYKKEVMFIKDASITLYVSLIIFVI